MVSVSKTTVLFSVILCCSAIRFSSNNYIEENIFEFLRGVEERRIAEIENLTATVHRSPIIKSLFEHVPHIEELIPDEDEEYSAERTTLACIACRAFFPSMISEIRAGTSEKRAARIMATICKLLIPFETNVCRKVGDMNMEALYYILRNRPMLGSKEVCSLLFQGQCGVVSPMFNFTVNVSPHDPITKSKSVTAPRSPDELRIIHITDTHYDEKFLPGGIKNCANPICCRSDEGISKDSSNRAGPWGEYKCNTPWQVLENTLKQIRRQHPQIDLIYHTGDLVDNGLWDTSQEYNKRIIGTVFDLLKRVFPNVPIYPTIGNHDHHPSNLFAPSTIKKPSLSSKWLYDFLAKTWQNHGWINADAAKTVRVGGSYTVLICTGFRLISFNNNEAYTNNFWVMYSSKGMANALQWFHDTLLQAEKNNEKVHVLAHVPTGDTCLQFWSRQYRRIIDRFHMIIGAQFNGHTHTDEFEVNYDVATGNHAVNIAWNGGSVTAYKDVNPNYRLYHVDRTHYQVNEAESFMFNISEANNRPAVRPRWHKYCTFSKTFGINNFSPAGIDQMVFNISRNRSLNRLLFQCKFSNGDPSIERGCDDNCLRKQLCTLVKNENNDERKCKKVLAVFGTDD